VPLPAFQTPAFRSSGSPSIFIAHPMRRNAATSPQVRIRTSTHVLLPALPQNHCSILILRDRPAIVFTFSTLHCVRMRSPKSSEFQPWVESPRASRCTRGRYNVRRLRWTMLISWRILIMKYCMHDASVRCFVSHHVWICPRFLAARQKR